MSDDGRHGVTLIAFIGSVFSPYYRWSRMRGLGDPLQHCALNVALYGDTRAWAMTERGAASLRRTRDELAIGSSALRWDGTALTVDIDERTMPFGRQLRGRVRVRPTAMTGRTFTLDEACLHRWSPLSPRAHVEVTLQNPELRWSGPGYLDSNDGDGPLEDSFNSWNWCRAGLSDGAAILYEVTPRSGGNGTSLALRVDRAGGVEPFAPPQVVALPTTRWRITRETRADGGRASVRRTLEDTPFYARSVLDSHLLGQPVTAMHENLSLERFRAPVVQVMLPFRMPRVRGRST